MPFFTANDNILGPLYYFNTEAAAAAFKSLHGGIILQTSSRIWRVTGAAA